MHRATSPGRRQRGFTYLAVLLAVAMLGAGLGAIGQVWRTVQQREKEKQLLFIGNEFRQAIGRYIERNADGSGRYPRSLDELLLDKRLPGIQRYLRRIYRDPITNSMDWGLVQAPDGGIAGVFSKSQAKPLKATGFATVNATFENAAKYSDWVFVYRGLQMPAVPRGTPTGPTGGEPTSPFAAK